MLKRVFQHFSVNSDFLKFFTLIAVGTIAWSLTMVKSGLIYPFGMGFWGANGHDGIWHIALINSLANGSGEMPIFAGEALKNYHIGFDLIVALVHKVTGISVVSLYFQKIPPVLALLTGVLTYRFVLDWKKSASAAFWATFFVYFGGSLGWLVELFRGHGIGGESMFWSQQGISSLVNPPFALSLVMILAGLTFIIRLTKKFSWVDFIPLRENPKRKLAGKRSVFASEGFRSRRSRGEDTPTVRLGSFILATLFLGLLFEVKVYAGVLMLAGLFFAVLKERKIFWIFISTFAVSLILFLAFNRGSPGLLVFKPFWFLETMMGLSDRLNWPRFYSAMINYRLGKVWFKAVSAYLIAFFIFYIGNMGTRLVKEFQVWKWIKNLKSVDIFDVILSVMIVAGTIIPMFFLQAGTPWNTIQFFYYALFAGGILAGVGLSEYLPKINTMILYIIVVVGILLLTLPTTIGTLVQVYLPSRPPAMISNAELEALSFLSKEPFGVVLTYPFDAAKAKAAEANPPRPLYLYDSTAYVSAIAGKPVFLEDEVNLDITGYDWRTRRKAVEQFYTSLDHSLVREFLKRNKIAYVYWLKGQRATLGEGQLGITRIFENNQVDIFKVD